MRKLSYNDKLLVGLTKL